MSADGIQVGAKLADIHRYLAGGLHAVDMHQRPMLVGDAGHLIDPLSGEGIGNAIYSGSIAAEQAQQCLLNNDFTAKTMIAYDVRVARVLGKEMEMSYRIQQLMARPWLVNFTANRVARNPNLIYMIAEMYADLEVRKKALNPLFWLKTLLKD